MPVANIFLFVIFFIAASAAIWRIQSKKTGLSALALFSAFGFKTTMAILYGYLFLKLYNGDDTWEIHKECLEAWEMLRSSPGEYFRQFLPSGSSSGETAAESLSIYLYNLEQHLISLMMLPLVPITGGNYYLMVIFLSAILFPAQCRLFSIFKQSFPDSNTIIYTLVFWFVPAVFWLSGLRADGVIFLAFTGILISFPQCIQKTDVNSLLHCFACCVLISIFRWQVAHVILPGLLAWWISAKRNLSPFKIFALAYAAGFVFLILLECFPLPFQPLSIIKNTQQAFLSLEGTRFTLPPLEGWKSWIEIFPYALSNSFLRPFLWEAHGPLQLMAGLESMLLIITAVAAFSRFGHFAGIVQKPLFCFLLFFSIFLYLSIGYIVPFPGAIVRYRIMGELILLLIFILSFERKVKL